MENIKAYCKNGKVMKVSLNGDLIDYKTEKEIIEEELIECKDLEDLIKKSIHENIDFSEYIDLSNLKSTEFEKKVYIETMKIQRGEVKTYKEIGDNIGSKGYRAVGNALNKNPIPIIIPCHRVIGSNMKLTGFNGGINLKKEILINEGIKVKNDKVIL
ncbi:putative methylated-DNA/protein-cysteine methyltransferase [Methanobrevibacter arboriphilus JCM 13429 = DSM 1125]|uniref:methylated-DNA--[protein]-cysteine S-methyltransferase n=1 Tax=Methanobrevibacter arboriphilus JCM 13429 = DSM 1125 TaxID=1300164 RepID=A0A1V6N4K7_METAZ|nr:MGMT family protein [Methanobrevibacter arboriphilus]OQD59640.1 putative methylated-DNA/protein-cysteine methyltransferase [Methanobrevibacter arboriphilus JCM 13429 = DSM 1125]